MAWHHRFLTFTAAFVLVLPLWTPASAQEGGGTISGTVTDEEPLSELESPLENVCVEAYSDIGGIAATATTDGDGAYTLEGLPAGNYAVGFNTCEEAREGYATEWWEEAAGPAEADFVMVDEGEDVDGIDATLPEAGTISGTVTDESGGEALADVCAFAFEGEVGAFGFTRTAEDGSYAIANLREGEYIVYFFDCGERGTYIPELYDDHQYRGNNEPSPEPDTVEVESGSETGDIDAALEEGVNISGTVTAVHTGEEVPFVCVGVWKAATADDGSTMPDFLAFSGFPTNLLLETPETFDGEYVVAGAPAGDYQIEFNAAACGDDAYRVEWYDGATARSEAATVSLDAGDVASGIDAVLQPLPSLSLACPESGPGAPFSDVDEDNVHERAIECAVAYDIAEGREDGTYGPERPVRRDQMAAFVVRLLSALEVEVPDQPDDHFDDDDGNHHELAINQLAELGVVGGTGDRRYSPQRHVPRGQMTTFLVNAYEVATGLTLRSAGDRFGDDDGTQHETSINRAATAGFAAGKTATTFAPDELVRRDQMASFLTRTLDRAFRDVFALLLRGDVQGESSQAEEAQAMRLRADTGWDFPWQGPADR